MRRTVSFGRSAGFVPPRNPPEYVTALFSLFFALSNIPILGHGPARIFRLSRRRRKLSVGKFLVGLPALSTSLPPSLCPRICYRSLLTLFCPFKYSYFRASRSAKPAGNVIDVDTMRDVKALARRRVGCRCAALGRWPQRVGGGGRFGGIAAAVPPRSWGRR